MAKDLFKHYKIWKGRTDATMDIEKRKQYKRKLFTGRTLGRIGTGIICGEELNNSIVASLQITPV